METFSLTRYLGRGFLRDRGLVISLISLPILLLVVGRESAPAPGVIFTIDSKLISSTSETLLLSLYALTSVVLVASVSSFSLNFRSKYLIPRLTLMGYKSKQIVVGFLFIVGGLNLFAIVSTWSYVNMIIDVRDPIGFFIGLFFASIIFSTIGLIFSELSDSKTLGLYLILTLTTIDTSFIENPVFSRRYNDDWIILMPSRQPLVIILRSFYDTGISWESALPFAFAYEAILIFLLYLIRSLKSTK